jgi:hypothetical protein
MPSISPRRASVSTGTFAAFSQRVLGADGLFLRNSALTDSLRRSVTKRLPSGAPEKMADRLGTPVKRLYHEHNGETRYSVDAFTAGLLELRPEEARHCLNRLASLVGARVIPNAQADDDISAVG